MSVKKYKMIKRGKMRYDEFLKQEIRENDIVEIIELEALQEEVPPYNKPDLACAKCGHVFGEKIIEGAITKPQPDDLAKRQSEWLKDAAGLSMDELTKIVSQAFYDNGYGGCPTVCPECNVDDFTHVEGCSYIGKELDVVIAHAVYAALQKRGSA